MIRILRSIFHKRNPEERISFIDHPPPNDIKGILIKYDDGIFSDRYDVNGQRKYREHRIVLGWKFMERRSVDDKSIQCSN